MRGLGCATAGLLAGVIGGALLLARERSPTASQTPPGAPSPASSVSPPGDAPPWSPEGVRARARDLAGAIAQQRAPSVGITEQELMGQPSSAAPAPSASQRVTTRARPYQADRATFSRLLHEHATERVVATWAREHEGRVRRTFIGSGIAPDDLHIACRSKTCVSRVRFASSAERASYLADAALPADCHGVTLAPGDLADDAPYEASIIHVCGP